MMFSKGEIWAYPTDTSFGLGVRADDLTGLKALAELKNRPSDKFFSLMVRDFAMLQKFAEVPENLNEKFFFEKSRTVILKPTKALPQTKFWPQDAVAFRISTIPEVSEAIEFPITATSANIFKEKPIFEAEKIRQNFDSVVKTFPGFEKLSICPPSEIWDFTKSPSAQLR